MGGVLTNNAWVVEDEEIEIKCEEVLSEGIWVIIRESADLGGPK